MKSILDISPDEMKTKISLHAMRLKIIEDGISVYCCCLEQDAYQNSITELWNLGIILQEYISKTKNEFTKFADEINMLD